MSFPALQTYTGGEVVRWIGAPGSDHPAPQVTLEAAQDADGGAAADGDRSGSTGGTYTGESDERTGGDLAALRTASVDDGPSTTLPTVLGAVGVLLGGLALGVAVTGRRRTA